MFALESKQIAADRADEAEPEGILGGFKFTRQQPSHEQPDTLLDVGCAFGHIILAALSTGLAGCCGCELPANMVQCLVFLPSQTLQNPTVHTSDPVCSYRYVPTLRKVFIAEFPEQRAVI